MDKNTLILLIHEDGGDGDYLRQALAGAEGRLRVQSVDRVPTGLARIAGGGVDLVVLDLSLSKKPEIERLDSLLKLRSQAPQVPIVVIHDSEDESLVMRAVQAGAADYLPRARCQTELGPLVRSVIGKRLVQLEARPHLVAEPRKAGAILTFLGAKGGVGTTTVALNVAAALAQWGRVILTELRPMFGTLPLYFHPHHLTGNLARLLEADAGTITPAEIEACLWPYKNIPGLNILFGPQSIEQCREIAAYPAEAALRALSLLTDYVVVDLPASLSIANRAVIQETDSLVLVVERDPLCVESARQILETIHAWKAMPASVGSVIVNRASLVETPLNSAEIEIQLAIPTLGVVPPATDLCLNAQQAGKPLLLFDPDSIAAGSLTSLAEALAAPTRTRARAS